MFNMRKFKHKITILVSVLLLLSLIIGGNIVFGGTELQNESIELTVYQNDLALVKEHRNLPIPTGIGSVSFANVAACIDPTSVRFTALTAPNIRVLEQNYEYDIVNDRKLLQKYLGQKISVTNSKGEIILGYLISADENLILSSQANSGQIQIIKAAQIQAISFPELPNGLIMRPTLVWLTNNPNKAGKQMTELTYLTTGLSWQANYVATINQDDNQVDLSSWVTLDNKSGTSYNEARLKLIAGDVNRVSKAEPGELRDVMYKAEATQGVENFSEKTFFEYHLYTLTRPTTLKEQQLKQVELLSATKIPAQKLFIYDSARNVKKIRTMLEFTNSTKNNLGMPLPKGIIRVQKADSDQALQFIGEDQIDHTPKDEKVRIYLGDAFDLTANRIQTNTKVINDTTHEESYQITLKNHKDTAVSVTALETFPTWGAVQITKADQKYAKNEANKIEFTVKVPANGQTIINYTVKIKN